MKKNIVILTVHRRRGEAAAIEYKTRARADSATCKARSSRDGDAGTRGHAHRALTALASHARLSQHSLTYFAQTWYHFKVVEFLVVLQSSEISRSRSATVAGGVSGRGGGGVRSGVARALPAPTRHALLARITSQLRDFCLYFVIEACNP